MKTLTCREHGGTFEIQPKRGRPPTICGGAYQLCTKADEHAIPPSRGSDPIMGKRVRVPKLTADESMERAKADSAAIRGAAPQADNPAVASALAARAKLEPQGWACRAKRTDGGGVAVLATRDEEMLSLVFDAKGACIGENYSLWHEKPSANSKPAGTLGFDPDECTDRELVRILAGSKVTWWNALGQFEMTGVIDPDKVKIEHLYNGKGDETPGDRIIHFIDRNGGGFRAFKMASLLKVG